MPRPISKRSKHEFKRLIESGVREVYNLPKPGLWFCVDEVEAWGQPPSRIDVWSTLTFTLEGSPFCCGEPYCYLPLNDPEGQDLLNDWVRREMGLSQPVCVDFGVRTSVSYQDGVVFQQGG